MPHEDIMRVRERNENEPPDDAPDTPTDEPKPAPVQDPPAEPDPRPYVVRAHGTIGHSQRESNMNHSEQTRNAGERRERRGFASMSPEKQREIASKGGRAAHQKGTAHEWTSEEARSAGRKGGQISRGGRGRLVDGSGPEGGDAPYRAEYNTPVNPERFGE
jgi:general stress protein YciG